MAIDITKVFKTNVKVIRSNLTGDDAEKSREMLNEELLGVKNSKKKSTKSISDTHLISKEAKNIVSNITTLKQFLIENKRAYLQPDYLLNSFSSSTSNDELDYQKFEEQAENIMRTCSDAIRMLKSKVSQHTLKHPPLTLQHSQHMENMFYLIEKYLKDVCNIYAQQKAIRVQRVVEKQKNLQLCSDELKNMKDELKGAYFSDDNLRDEIEKSTSDEIKDPIISSLTEQELMELEKENEQLYEDLTIESEDIKQIESRVIEVSRLAQIITENIVSQSATAEQIHVTSIETNSNLNMGNESIKEAMKKGAALRLWILFIIIVLSFTLLFLDWYND